MIKCTEFYSDLFRCDMFVHRPEVGLLFSRRWNNYLLLMKRAHLFSVTSGCLQTMSCDDSVFDFVSDL